MGQPIEFELSPEQKKAIQTLAGTRQVRLSGRVVKDKLRVDFVACNAAFMACNAAFDVATPPSPE
ncbi:hypothetical protein [Streptomyces sp. DSM 41634]|uniref:hypothetical protein n=1 Tax=Streptomyces sp. DSM 41634 TaxID=3448656 RepID=UPI0040402716